MMSCFSDCGGYKLLRGEQRVDLVLVCVCVRMCYSDGNKLQGVRRVGLVAKGLLLKRDMDLELVMLCSDTPTSKLLDTIATKLQEVMKVSRPLIPPPH